MPNHYLNNTHVFILGERRKGPRKFHLQNIRPSTEEQADLTEGVQSLEHM